MSKLTRVLRSAKDTLSLLVELGSWLSSLRRNHGERLPPPPRVPTFGDSEPPTNDTDPMPLTQRSRRAGGSSRYD